MYFIHNATIYTPDAVLAESDLLIIGDRIASIGDVKSAQLPVDVQRIEARGLILVPGWLDLQINGGFGFDFTENPASLWDVAAQLPRYGVTSFLPTLITSPPEKTAQALEILAQGPPPGFQGASPLGWHLEGPFLNPGKKGAHNPVYLRDPSANHIEFWSPENGVLLVTLAPELPDALNVIRELRGRGVVVSAGHSSATYDQALAGLDAGITYGTHIFNAMTALHHRQPGLPGALLADPRATVGLIADGIHVHPTLCKLIWQVKGSHGLTLVSDAMAALGMPSGEYVLGDYHVQVDDTTARLNDGTLAGSILTPDAALRNLMAFTGASLAEALPTLTSAPARLLGLAGRGELVPGNLADLALLTPNLQVAATWVEGELTNHEP